MVSGKEAKFMNLRKTTALIGLILAPGLSVAEETVRLAPIVIEATKNAQNWKDYPGTIARADAKDLKKRSVRKVTDMEKIFSGLSFSKWSNPSFVNINLRGPPSRDIYTSNVQLYVDGVPQNHLELGQSLPFGVESAEVLYGPQGTLYGHGAAGGVINIISRKPGEGEAAAFESEVGTGRRSIRGSGEARIADGLWGDLALGVQREGDDLKRASGGAVGGTTTRNGRVRLRYAPDDSPWDVLLQTGRSTVSSTAEQLVARRNFSSRKIMDIPFSYDQDTNSFSLTASRELGSGEITSVLSYSDSDLKRTNFGFYHTEQQKTPSLELRYSSDKDQNVSAVTGLHLRHSDFTRDFFGIVDIRTQSASVFNDTIWSATDKLKISPGLRFDYEGAKATYTKIRLMRQNYTKNSGSWNQFSPKLGISYALNEDTQLFSRIATGFRSGGLGKISVNGRVHKYNSQRTSSAEIGVKVSGETFSGSLAGYYTHTSGYQMYTGQGAFRALQDVGKVDSKGVDMQLRYSGDGPGITATASWNDSIFTEYKDPTRPNVDLKGKKVPLAPRWMASVSVDYPFDLGDGLGRFVPRAGLSYKGKVFFNEENTDNLSQSSYTLFDAGASWELDRYDVVLDLYGTNLTNKTHAVYGAAGNGFTKGQDSYALGKGREIGLVVRKSF